MVPLASTRSLMRGQLKRVVCSLTCPQASRPMGTGQKPQTLQNVSGFDWNCIIVGKVV